MTPRSGTGAASTAGTAVTRTLLELRRARRDPIAFLERVASGGDIVSFPLADRPAFLLSHPAAIEGVLVTHGSRFAKPPALDRASRLLGQGLLTAEASRHAIRRRTIAPVFHRPRMGRYADIMARVARRHADGWRDGAVIDAVPTMAAITLAVIGEALFSADLEPLGPELRRILAGAVGALDPIVALVAPMRRLRPARLRLLAIVDELVARRLDDPAQRDDLLTLLLQAEGDDATPAQLRDDALTMLLAGHDTIANALAWTWWWLAGHPDVEARLYDEVDTVLAGRSPTAEDLPRLTWTRAVLAESLRLRPPAWILARRALEDHPCDDTTIPAGALVVMSPLLVHRDPRFYADALRFDPTRWLAAAAPARPKLAYFPFGAGRRSCIGEAFAMMEGVVVLATVAQRWRLRIDAGAALEPRITLRPRGPMLARVESRA